MWLKACPRCGGDLYQRQEPEGTEITCIQCSRSFSMRQLLQAVPELEVGVAAGVEAEEEVRAAA